MTLNDHITTSATAMTSALEIVIEMGLTVRSAHIGARNPRIVLAESPPSGTFKSAIFSREFDGIKTRQRAVSMIGTCQVEWEL